MHGRIIHGAAAEMPVSRNTKVLCAPESAGARTLRRALAARARIVLRLGAVNPCHTACAPW
jgi:hypothetical protein